MYYYQERTLSLGVPFDNILIFNEKWNFRMHYEKPEFHYVPNSGGISGKEIAKLSDGEFADYLKNASLMKKRSATGLNLTSL